MLKKFNDYYRIVNDTLFLKTPALRELRRHNDVGRRNSFIGDVNLEDLPGQEVLDYSYV